MISTFYFNPRAPYGARLQVVCFRNLADYISIHAPHTGRDSDRGIATIPLEIFQSTRPIRGATSTRQYNSISGCYFNPRAPYGARLKFLDMRAGDGRFQSTRPIRGATKLDKANLGAWYYFNPRAPYGARQQKCIIYVLHFCNNRQSKHKNQQETSSVRTFF